MYTKDGITGDSVLGLAPDFKFTQQDLTELNADGNRERGRNGEDTRIYIESDLPQEDQKYKGWFWSYPEKKFYRWDNRPK